MTPDEPPLLPAATPLACTLSGVVLRPLTAADADAFARHVDGDLGRLARHLPWCEPTRTPDGAAAWLGRYERREEGRVLAAGAWRGGRLLGGAALLSHVPGTQSVELGVWVVAPAAGTGLAAACCLELLRVARTGLSAERIVWQCDTQNVASRRLAGRLGFRFEGTQRAAAVLRGERRDLDLLSLVGAEIDVGVNRPTVA